MYTEYIEYPCPAGPSVTAPRSIWHPETSQTPALADSVLRNVPEVKWHDPPDGFALFTVWGSRIVPGLSLLLPLPLSGSCSFSVSLLLRLPSFLTSLPAFLNANYSNFPSISTSINTSFFIMNSIFGTGRIGTGLCRRAFSLRTPSLTTRTTASRRTWHVTRKYSTQTGSKWPQQHSGGGISTENLVKYTIPGVLLLGTLLFMSRRNTEQQTTDAVSAIPSSANASVLPTESYIQVGPFTFHQREVEEAFIANPDQFIADVMHLSSDLAPLSPDDEGARYRALCLFARNILLVDTACTSDVLRIARIHFEKAVRAERETVAYRLAVYGHAVRGSVVGLVKSFGSYIGGHISALFAVVEDQFRFLWHKVSLANQ